MEEIEAQTIRLQKQIDACGVQNAAALQPQVDRLMATLAQKGLPVPARLRRLQTTLRLEAEDDFFDNMPV
jgi:hypothetical protein